CRTRRAPPRASSRTWPWQLPTRWAPRGLPDGGPTAHRREEAGLMDDRIRVATLQYLIRPIETFEQFAAQVTGLVETAADYKCRLVLFPEYFTLQLLTLGDVRAPIREQVKRLSGFVPRYVELFAELSRKHGRYLC